MSRSPLPLAPSFPKVGCIFKITTRRYSAFYLLAAIVWFAAAPASGEPANLDLWKIEFPKTDFDRKTVALDEIRATEIIAIPSNRSIRRDSNMFPN
jgi:hypothetical protein